MSEHRRVLGDRGSGMIKISPTACRPVVTTYGKRLMEVATIGRFGSDRERCGKISASFCGTLPFPSSGRIPSGAISPRSGN